MSDPQATTEDYEPFDRGTVTEPSPDSFVPDRRVVAGSGAQFDWKTQGLLHQRLRAVAVVLVFAFGLFFVLKGSVLPRLRKRFG